MWFFVNVDFSYAPKSPSMNAGMNKAALCRPTNKIGFNVFMYVVHCKCYVMLKEGCNVM